MKFCLPKIICGLTLLGAAGTGEVLAQSTVLFSSDGSSASPFVNSWYSWNYTQFGTGTGCTVESATPFEVNGIGQGSYLAATSYPMASFNSQSASSQGVWVGYLMQATSPNHWAGGISLIDGSTSQPYNWTYDGLAGWYGNSQTITVGDAGYNNATGGYSVADGQPVAVLARFYDRNNSGTFNTASLYVDGNLADGINFSTPIVSEFDFSSAFSSISAIRLGADPTGSGETRYYDNIVVATTQQDALDVLSNGQIAAVPEPSTLGLAGLGGLGMLWKLRRRK